MRRFICFLLTGLWLFCACSTQGPTDVATSGTKSGNALVSGSLLSPNGQPASNAEVALRPMDFLPKGIPGTPSGHGQEVVTTADSNGCFSFPEIPDGLYLVEARLGDTLGIVMDSIAVHAKADTLMSGSLRPLGSLTGTLVLPDTLSTASAVVCFPGFRTFLSPDSTGHFNLNGLSSAPYRIRILVPATSLVRWDTVDVKIRPDSTTNLDTISLVSYWRSAGSRAFSNRAAGSMALLDFNGSPCMAYQDADSGNRIGVVRYNGSAWTFLGLQGMTDGPGKSPRLLDDRGTLSLFYIDANRENRLTGLRWTGASWLSLGTGALSPAEVSSYAVCSDTAVVWAAVSVPSRGDSVFLRYFTGVEWRDTLSPGCVAEDLDLKCVRNVLYLAYADNAAGNRLVALRFGSGGWTSVGAVSEGASAAIRLQAMEGSPVVAFRDSAHGNGVSVMRYGADGWSLIGNAGFNNCRTGDIQTASFGQTLFVAYQNEDYLNQLRVAEWNGLQWEMLSIEKLPWSPVNSIALEVVDGTPWAAFQEAITGNRISVLKYIRRLF